MLMKRMAPKGWIVVFHISQRVNGEESSMKGFYSTLVRSSLKGIGLIKKQK